MYTLREIVDILQTSTIAEERGKDLRSKFWAAYKKVSGEFDDNMLERCNGNMDILLLFAGLFSAANTAFIIAMQPNPLDTTNALLVQLIQITLQGPSATTPVIHSASTNYSSNFWMEALAYMSLALSLLAAFGAVLGKQWLNYYKTHRFGSGSLEQRCMQRHSKYQGLKTWCFEGVLQSFADLLKASLFLFGVFLGAITWAEQKTISILIITATAFGLVFYLGTIVASLVYPNCPFQTRLSSAIHTWHTDPKSKTSIADAMEWMLKNSTNPDAIGAAIELMPTISETLEHENFTKLCKKLRGMFEACFDAKDNLISKDGALAYGKALIQFAQNNVHRPKKANIWTLWRTPENEPVPRPNIWTSWRALYLPQALEQCQNSYKRMRGAHDEKSQLLYQANTRSALRMAVPACMDEFASPDDEKLIWKCAFELELDQPKVDWLMDCAKHFLVTKDFVPAGDALLLLSGTLKSSPFLSQSQGQGLIAQYLNRTLDSPHRSPRCCHIALRVAYQILNNNHNLPCDESFSQAIIKAVCAAVGPTDNPQDNNDHFQFNTAIEFLTFTTLPKGSYLQPSLLQDIQLLVLRVLPAPMVNEHETFIKYCNALKHHIHASQSQLRSTALRLACDLRKDLATISADGVHKQLRDRVLSQLSQLFLNFPNAVSPHDSDCDGYFYLLRLVSCLASHSSWFRFLDENGDIERYIGIIPEFREDPPRYVFYLATLFLRIQAAHPKQAADQLKKITSTQWWDLMRMAWRVISRDKTQGECDVLDDDTETLGALVTGTRMHMPHALDELRPLRGWLSSTFKKLESRQSHPDETILAVKGLRDRVHYLILEAKRVEH